MREHNILTVLLDRLNIKYTSTYATMMFNENPNKDNLLGISEMLSLYRINNIAIKLDKLEDIFSITTPFITERKGEFVLIESTNDKICYYTGNRIKKVESIEEFFSGWSGVVLVIYANSQSIENNYDEHKKNEQKTTAKKYLLGIGVFFLLLLSALSTNNYLNLHILALFFINITGFAIGRLLLLNELNIYNKYSEKLCSLIETSNCKSILKSNASKAFLDVSWSEIGLCYFFSNLIIISFYPTLIPSIGFINLFALPYTFWSVWFQGVKVKQWCVMCLLVQLLLWINFLVNIYFISNRVFEINFLYLSISVFIYLLSLLGIVHIISYVKSYHDLSFTRQQFNSVKAEESVFKSLMREQPFYSISGDNSSIFFGNSASQLCVTIITNPKCDPCARLHKQITELLKDEPSLQFQYIFTPFTPELAVASRCLIAIFQQKNIIESHRIYSEWFEKGRHTKDFFEKYGIDAESKEVLSEFEKHNFWVNENLISETPIVLVNGYRLSKYYEIKDLRYLTDIELED
ncbi:vitamin K epoxide reductase family protein [Porphyromonas levii]|uniref:vitamin K epoxide reductase family protein n=1 Tax=Porphyromonas levii TaxID=28114 RepID=UPI000367D59F|nr:vitamin K epoxide reductase family protein [Porphyromonas levii]